MEQIDFRYFQILPQKADEVTRVYLYTFVLMIPLFDKQLWLNMFMILQYISSMEEVSLKKIVKIYINIGSPKGCCFFVQSSRLFSVLEKYPFIYDAIEEAVITAQQGYYAAGILAFSQLFKQLGGTEPESRNDVAHEFLRKKPTKEGYDSVKKSAEDLAERLYHIEQAKLSSRKEYYNNLHERWKKYMKVFHNTDVPDMFYVE